MIKNSFNSRQGEVKTSAKSYHVALGVILLFACLISFSSALKPVTISEPTIAEGSNLSINVNNSDYLDGYDSSYFYQASNPNGYISEYTEFDPLAVKNNSVANLSKLNVGNIILNATSQLAVFNGNGAANGGGASDIYLFSNDQGGRPTSDTHAPEHRIYGYKDYTGSGGAGLKYAAAYVDWYGRLVHAGTVAGYLFSNLGLTGPDSYFSLISSDRYKIGTSSAQKHGDTSGYSAYLGLDSYSTTGIKHSSEMIIDKMSLAANDHLTPYSAVPTFNFFNGDGLYRNWLRVSSQEITSNMTSFRLNMGVGKSSDYNDGTNRIINTTTGSLYIYNSTGLGVVHAAQYLTSTEINNDYDVIDTIPLGEDLLNADGTINHEAFGSCFVNATVADYSRPVNRTVLVDNCFVVNQNDQEASAEVICDGKKEIIETYYPYTKLQPSEDTTCMLAKVTQATALYGQSAKPLQLENGTALNAKIIMTDVLLWNSHPVLPNTDYVGKFKNATKFFDKKTHPNYQQTILENGTAIDNLHGEMEIVDLQGYVLTNEFCRRNNKKWEDYNICMDAGVGLK